MSSRFGDERIFFDRSTIEGGDVFPDTLRRSVEGCAALVALIAPDWLEVRGADGSRRLDDPHDFVRQEIALALTRGKKVIPVLFDDAPVPPADRLPEPLKALTGRDVPLDWAATQNNLGNALATLGERESGAPDAGRGRLEEAVAAYRAALEEWTRARVPLDWAATQNNLGNALATLGERTQDVLKLKEAREAIAAAFEVFMEAGQEHHRAFFEERLRGVDRKIADLG